MTQSQAKRILYPIYHFLPCATTHIHRVMRFLNYLADTGKYEITVLTCKNPNDILYDENLIHKLDPRIKVLRTNAILFGIHNKSKLLRSYLQSKYQQKRTNYFKDFLRRIYKFTIKEVFNLINVPDSSIGWLPFALLKGRKLLQTDSFDIIFTTGPPFSNFVLSALLKNESTKLVVDYRDPWKNNYYMERNYRTEWQVKLSRHLEKYVLSKSDLVIANTNRMKDFIMSENNNSFTDGRIRVEVIYNGFNYENSVQNIEEHVLKNTLTFLFSGRFHGTRLTPRYLLEAMRDLIDAGQIDKDRIRVVFLGNLIPSDFEHFSHVKTDDFCDFRGMVPHEENLRLMNDADCLVVICSTGTVDRMLVPSKIYEYLNTNNMILGLLPPGEARDVLQKSGGAVLVSPDDLHAIKDGILQIYNRFLRQGNLGIQRNTKYVVENFDAKKQCEKLERILDNLLEA